MSLRTTIFVVMLGATLYVGGFAFYLMTRVLKPAAALAEGTETILTALEEVQARHDALDVAHGRLVALSAGREPAGDQALAGVRRLIAAGAAEDRDARAIPAPAIDAAIIRIDARLEALRAALQRLVHAVGPGGGSRHETAPLVLIVDSLHQELDAERSAAGYAARAELLERQARLREAAGHAPFATGPSGSPWASWAFPSPWECCGDESGHASRRWRVVSRGLPEAT